jgi:ATP-dependent Clp protease ATP-binding subunit ClpA
MIVGIVALTGIVLSTEVTLASGSSRPAFVIPQLLVGARLASQISMSTQPSADDWLFGRMTESSLRLLFFARDAVSRHGNQEVDVSHLLYGLFEAASTLERLGVSGSSAEALQSRAIALMSPKGTPPLEAKPVPFARPARAVLLQAINEADALQDKDVRPEHILLALLKTDARGVAPLLAEIGVTREGVLAALKQR